MITKKDRVHVEVIKFVLLIFLIFFSAILFSFEFLTIKEKKLQGRIYPNVYIDKINYGEKTEKETAAAYDAKNRELKKIIFTVIYENQPVATFSGEKLKLRFDSRGIAQRAYLIGRSSNPSSRFYQKFVTLFNLSTFKFVSTLEYERFILDEFIAHLEEKYNKPAKNALFTFTDSRVVNFRQEEHGLRIESDKFFLDFETAVFKSKRDKTNKTITISTKIINPEIKLSSANNFGIEQLIGEGKSDFTHSIPERIHNLTLAASKFNGVLIPKDKIFSFNDTIGDISSLTGYKQAYIIKNGKTILGDGGGVCQASTTLFRAALNTGLPISERTAHAYRVGYYENDSKPGFDATVFAPAVDFKIKNDTPSYILIQTEIDQENNLLYFRLYGKKDGRKVTLSVPTVYDQVAPPPPVYQDDPTLKKGVTKQIDFAAWGAKAFFDYQVTRDNQTIFEKRFFSSYRPWQAIYLVGQAE